MLEETVEKLGEIVADANRLKESDAATVGEARELQADALEELAAATTQYEASAVALPSERADTNADGSDDE